MKTQRAALSSIPNDVEQALTAYGVAWRTWGLVGSAGAPDPTIDGEEAWNRVNDAEQALRGAIAQAVAAARKSNA